VQIQGFVRVQELSTALRRTMARCKDLRPAWEVVGMDLLRSVEGNFNAEGRPSAWAPWSPAYAAYRAKKKPGKILTRDGNLRRSITSEPDARGVTLGSNVAYARAQQLGYQPRNLPPRPFVAVQDEDWDKIERTIGDYIAGAWS
jgi:phage virion morphogenesis protein